MEALAILALIAAYLHWRSVRPITPADLGSCLEHRRARNDDGTPVQ
jgi:hypothetical protein